MSLFYEKYEYLANFMICQQKNYFSKSDSLNIQVATLKYSYILAYYITLERIF